MKHYYHEGPEATVRLEKFARCPTPASSHRQAWPANNLPPPTPKPVKPSKPPQSTQPPENKANKTSPHLA